MTKPFPVDLKDGQTFTRFTAAMKHILTIPKEELQRREAAYKAKADLNPNKRGPKRKSTA